MTGYSLLEAFKRHVQVVFALLVWSSLAPAQSDYQLRTYTQTPQQLKVGSGVSITGERIYVKLANENGSWKVISTDFTRPNIDNNFQELLTFSRDLSVVEPYFVEYAEWARKKEAVPGGRKYRDTGANGSYDCETGESQSRPKYSPCVSKLTVIQSGVNEVAKNTFVAVFTLGTSLLTGGVLSNVVIDKSLLLAVVNESGAFEAAKKYLQDVDKTIWLNNYRGKLSESNDIGKLRKAIATYKNNDPEELVPRAEQRLAELLAEEAATKYRNYKQGFAQAKTIPSLEGFIAVFANDDPDDLVPKARELLKLMVAKEAADQEKARQRDEKNRVDEQKRITLWRSLLREGDETNCGPVIEVKQKLVRVAVAIKDYGSDRWLRRDEIFPRGFSCEFFNGQYRAPG